MTAAMFFRTSVLSEGSAKDLDAAGDFCDNCEAGFTEQTAVVELREDDTNFIYVVCAAHLNEREIL